MKISPCIRGAAVCTSHLFGLVLTMSVRVVARIRPLQRTEIEKDVILEVGHGQTAASQTTLIIPNPKCQSENYSFQFNSVYDRDSTQAQIFDNEGEAAEVHGFDLN